VCPWIWKVLLLLGLGMSFGGLVCMIEARKYIQGGKSHLMPTIQSPVINKIGWSLTIGGFICQVIGVIISP